MTNWNDLTELERKCYCCFGISGHIYDNYDPNEYDSFVEFPRLGRPIRRPHGMQYESSQGCFIELRQKGLD